MPQKVLATLCLFVLLVLSLKVSSQPVQAPQRVTSTFDYVPAIGGTPIVHTPVDEKTSLTLEIDTGAGVSLLSEETAKSLGLVPQPAIDDHNKPILIDGKQAKYVLVKNLVLGQQKLDIPFVIVEDAKLTIPGAMKCDGILGANVLQDYAVCFDFQRHHITLYEGGCLSAQEQSNIGFSKAFVVSQADTTHSVFLMSGLINNEVRGDFVFDTGADTSIITNEAAKALGLKPTGKPRDRYTFIGKFKFDHAKVSELSLGGLTLHDIVLGYPHKPLSKYPMQIGMDVLSQYSVLLDFVQHKVYFKPNGQANLVPSVSAPQ